MLAYHGTTRGRARRIFDEGFLAKPPSRRVWFAESRRYAMGRAKTQARRANDLPVVLACEIDLESLRRRTEIKRAVHRRGIIAVDGPVPAAVLREDALADMATVPAEVAEWVNALLELNGDDVAKAKHPGVRRLSRWINAQVADRGEPMLRSGELLERARRWMPEFFAQARVDIETLRSRRHVGFVETELDARSIEPDPREAEALACLEDERPERRVAGLELLAEIHDPDLFDWCAMFAGDEDTSVQIAALRTMLQCEAGSAETIEPLVAAPERRVRAAAIAALGTFGEADAPRWIERGLNDPEPCVRMAAARFLGSLNPRRHHAILMLARQDPNPDIARRARRILS